MKKIAIILLVALASCDKDRTCKCNNTVETYTKATPTATNIAYQTYTTTTVTKHETTKKDIQHTCVPMSKAETGPTFTIETNSRCNVE